MIKRPELSKIAINTLGQHINHVKPALSAKGVEFI